MTHYNIIPLNSKSIPTITRRYPVHEFFTLRGLGKITNNGANDKKKKKDGSETNSDIRTRVHNNQQIEHK